MRIAIVVILSIAGSSAALPIDRGGSTGPPSGDLPRATVDFELRGNLIVVPVVLDGERMSFLLDTGASATVVGEDAARQLGLEAVDRGVGAGAGGDVEVAFVRLEAIAVGDIRLRDVTAMTIDLEDLNGRLGGGISGILGFDFLSRFRTTIDYRDRRLTFERYGDEEEPDGPTFAVEGHRFISEQGLGLERPDGSWNFVTDTPLSRIAVILEKPGTGGKVTVQVIPLHGLGLDQVIPSIEPSLRAQVEGFELVSAAEEVAAGRECYVVDYAGREDGNAQRFRYYLFKVAENLYSLKAQAGPAEFASLTPEFDGIVESVTFEEGR